MLSTTQKRNSYLLWGWHIGALFMTVLSLKNEKLYHQIGRREIPLEEFTASVKGLSLWTTKRKNGFSWAALLYLGAYGNEPTEKLEHEFGRLGVWDASDKDSGTFQGELNRFTGAYSDWGRDSYGVFSRIYGILEELRTFAEV